MNKKQLILLGMVLVTLALAAVLTRSMKDHSRSEVAEIYTPLARSFDSSKIARISIALGKEADPVELAREGDAWAVKSLWDAKADQEKVKALLDALLNLKGELRSSDKSLLGDFGIRDGEAISLKIFTPGNVAELELQIGIKKAGFDGFFVRTHDSSNVYLTDTPFDRLLGIFVPLEEAELSPNFWADLTLFKLKPEEVKKITVTYLKDGAVQSTSGVERIEQKDAPQGFWKLLSARQAAPADPEKVLRFIATLNSVKAKSVADPEGTGYGLESPLWRLAVTEAEKEIVLEAGPQETTENIYFVKFKDSPQVFCLAAYYFEDLDIKNDEQFLKDAPEASPKP